MLGGGGGVSGPKDKQDTDGQPYVIPFRIQVRVYIIYNFELNVMNKPQKSISGDTGITV